MSTTKTVRATEEPLRKVVEASSFPIGIGDVLTADRSSLDPSLLRGGYALTDGVCFYTDSVWVEAREDGSLEVGEMEPSRLSSIPFLRVIAFFVAMLLETRKTSRAKHQVKLNSWRFWRSRQGILTLCLLGVLDFPFLLKNVLSMPWLWFANFGLLIIAIEFLPWIGGEFDIWRFHAAEHKAISALERGISLTDLESVMKCPRVHMRCGGNGVFLFLLLTPFAAVLPTWLFLVLFPFAVAIIMEMVVAVTSRPQSVAARLVTLGGRFMLRNLTTAEPSIGEQMVACRALSKCLEEHFRLEAGAAISGLGSREPTSLRTASR